MTNRLLRSLLRMYNDIYAGDPYERLKVVSFLIYKGKIVNFGVNTSKTSPLQYKYRQRTSLRVIEDFLDKEHAEINCLRHTYFGDFDMRKIEVVVISKRENGDYRLARPCPVCMAALRDFGVKKVWYTTNANTIDDEDI